MSGYTEDDEDTRLARGGRTGHIGGKLTQRLDVPVSEEVMDAVAALAALAGCTKAELGRMLIERALFGELHMVRSLARPAMSGRWDGDGSNR